METTSFFAGTTRVVKLGSPTLLIAKGGTRRLRLPIKMPLTGQNLIVDAGWQVASTWAPYGGVRPACKVGP